MSISIQPLTPNEIDRLLKEELDSLSVVERRRMFFQAFDSAAAFLLELRYENLYFPTSSEWIFICKGCSKQVTRIERLPHFTSHKREYNKVADSVK